MNRFTAAFIRLLLFSFCVLSGAVKASIEILYLSSSECNIGAIKLLYF